MDYFKGFFDGSQLGYRRVDETKGNGVEGRRNLDTSEEKVGCSLEDGGDVLNPMRGISDRDHAGLTASMRCIVGPLDLPVAVPVVAVTFVKKDIRGELRNRVLNAISQLTGFAEFSIRDLDDDDDTSLCYSPAYSDQLRDAHNEYIEMKELLKGEHKGSRFIANNLCKFDINLAVDILDFYLQIFTPKSNSVFPWRSVSETQKEKFDKIFEKLPDDGPLKNRLNRALFEFDDETGRYSNPLRDIG